MIVYGLANGLTGERLEPLYPTSTPSWARRPEPVAWSATFQVRSQMRVNTAGGREPNSMRGLQHRIRPWRDVITVSWQDPAGGEITLATGIVKSPLEVDEAAGTLTVETVCARTMMADRFLLTKNQWPLTAKDVTVTGRSWQGLVSEIVRIATTDYAALPQHGFEPVGGFALPIDRPEATAGGRSEVWYGYNFKDAAEALDDVEEKAGVVVDFRPYWRNADSRHRWNLEVFADTARAGIVIDLGSTGAVNPQAVYSGTKVDSSETVTVTHHTGKGSEADILYTRKSDTSPTMMAREKLYSRPDTETTAKLVEQADAEYLNARTKTDQDSVRMRIDPDNPDWVDPRRLRLGATVQLTLEDSLQYGHTTLHRTLIGWKAAGDRAIDLELQDLTADAGV